MTDTKSITKIDDLRPDPRNANAGTERGAYMVEHSLSKYGAGRSILVDKNGVVIAGNKTLQAAEDFGIPVKVVQADGKELVVVQRTDLDLLSDDDRARLMAYADNRASEVGLEWNAEELLADVTADLDLSDLFRDDELAELIQGIELIPHDDSEYKAGSSPWERMDGDAAKGVLFQFGSIVCRCTERSYQSFVESCPETNISSYVEELLAQ